MTHAKHDTSSMIHLGFWTYLMSDCIMFGVLFAVYLVLRNNTFGGPTAQEIIVPSYALIETLLFLTSSFCCCLMGSQNKKRVLFWLTVTFLLGLAVFAMGSFEFIRWRTEGAVWEKSGFLSALFTLVGTHEAHVAVGLLWMVVMMFQVSLKGLTSFTQRRLDSLRLFWQFLNIIWIFIFTIVYMMGAAA